MKTSLSLFLSLSEKEKVSDLLTWEESSQMVPDGDLTVVHKTQPLETSVQIPHIINVPPSFFQRVHPIHHISVTAEKD
jgi:hypothetical protein